MTFTIGLLLGIGLGWYAQHARRRLRHRAIARARTADRAVRLAIQDLRRLQRRSRFWR